MFLEIVIAILIGLFIGFGWGQQVKDYQIHENVKSGKCQIIDKELYCSK